MDVFACYLVNDRSVVDFVKSVNKLPRTDQNGDWPSIPFALIRLLQALTKDTVLQLSGQPFPRRKRTRSCLPEAQRRAGTE
jgi:hypothetical protein